MKKIWCLILLGILLLTGCSKNTIYDNNTVDEIDYNLNITDYYQEFIVTTLPSNAYDTVSRDIEEDIPPLEYVLLQDSSYPLLGDFDTVYQKDIEEIENGYKVSLEHKYTEEDYLKSTFLNTCFENKSIIQEEDYLEINVSGRMNCYMNKTTRIYVTTPLEVLESNGTKENDSYYWILDTMNNEATDIHLKIAREKSTMKRGYTNAYSLGQDLLIIFGLMIGLCVLLVLYHKYSKKK